jgi:PAS domain S-box-containing protein
MSDPFGDIVEEYTAALQEYLSWSGEAALQRGYELGRRALGRNLGVLDMAAIHQEALLDVLSADESSLIARRAADFFMEALSPHEMSRRGAQETVARVRESNAALERRVAERAEALRQAEKKYRDLFENAVEGIFQLSADGRLITANPALARIFGYESPGHLIVVAADALPSSIGPCGLAETLRRISDDGVAASIEVPARKRDGTAIWISINGRVLRNADGTIRHYDGSVEDVSERKRAEILGVAQRQILEMIVTGASVAEVLPTIEKMLQEQSAATSCVITLEEERRGSSGSSVLARPAAQSDKSLAQPVASSSAPGWWAVPISSANGGLLAMLELAYPSEYGAVDVPPLRDAPIIAAATRLAGIAIDRERGEQALRRAELQRLQTEKLRALGQLAGGIAHDLNQSLALVAGYGELAQDALHETDFDADAMKDMLRIMRQAALDGGETVKQLLTFARTREDGPPVQVDVRQLLRDVARLTSPRWRDAAEATGCHISLHVEADDGIVILGWPPSLREALTNLVFNAVDALPSGGVIHLAAYVRGGHGIVEVTDSGIGMSPEVAARIFEPFFTTKGEGGNGLGLAHVFAVVGRHDGEISVRSTPGRGTTFEMMFPISSGSESRSASPTIGAGRDRKLRILAVDDEPALGGLIASALGKDGHVVMTATSGEAALLKLSVEPIDLVISDVGMGVGMTGWDLAEQVRQRWPHVRLVLATGWGAAIDSEAARDKGVAGVIAKPYRLADLRRAVNAVDGP